jgi:hypothetical protein
MDIPFVAFCTLLVCGAFELGYASASRSAQLGLRLIKLDKPAREQMPMTFDPKMCRLQRFTGIVMLIAAGFLFAATR